jgi:hypothetical protein
VIVLGSIVIAVIVIAITLIVEVANAGGAQMILTASTVRFVLNA